MSLVLWAVLYMWNYGFVSKQQKSFGLESLWFCWISLRVVFFPVLVVAHIVKKNMLGVYEGCRIREVLANVGKLQEITAWKFPRRSRFGKPNNTHQISKGFSIYGMTPSPVCHLVVGTWGSQHNQDHKGFTEKSGSLGAWDLWASSWAFSTNSNQCQPQAQMLPWQFLLNTFIRI